MIKRLVLLRSPGRRRLAVGLLLLLAGALALGLLLRRAGAGPEAQVERFVHGLAEAFNAADLGEQQRRDELSAALAQFFLPEQRAAARARIHQSLEQLAATRLGRDSGQAQQQDVHEQLTFHDLETQLHQRSPTAVEVELVAGNTRFQWVGDDVAAAVPTGRQAPLELPVGIFLANTRGWLFSAVGASAGQRFLLEERDGQWYLLLQSP